MQGFREVLENRGAIFRAEAADRSGPLNEEGDAPGFYRQGRRTPARNPALGASAGSKLLLPHASNPNGWRRLDGASANIELKKFGDCVSTFLVVTC